MNCINTAEKGIKKGSKTRTKLKQQIKNINIYQKKFSH